MTAAQPSPPSTYDVHGFYITHRSLFCSQPINSHLMANSHLPDRDISVALRTWKSSPSSAFFLRYGKPRHAQHTHSEGHCKGCGNTELTATASEGSVPFLDCPKSPSRGTTSAQCILKSPALPFLPSFSSWWERQKRNTVITIAISSNMDQNMFHYSFFQIHWQAWGWHPTISHDYVCSQLQIPYCKSSPTENEIPCFSWTVWMHVSLTHWSKHLWWIR